jgi:AcrR family transcriptional regulator
VTARRPAAAKKKRGRGRPPGGEQVADRDAILAAAERVIARTGSSASLDEIAAEAGVTKPIVYDRIGSRAELSNALATRLSSHLLERAAHIDAPFDRDGLAMLFRITFETLADHRELFLYVTRGAADDTAERALFLASLSAQPLAKVIESWRTQQSRDQAVALPWAFGLVGMLNMAALWWLEEGDRPVGQLADELADLAWSGMGGGEAS